MISKEQAKDLRPMRLEDLGADRTFYKRDENGDYSTCNLSELEIFYFRPTAEKLIKEGRLFVRKNAPYRSFAWQER